MTKNKINDFIKTKQVKEYIKSIGGRNSEQFLIALKLDVKQIIDNFYKKTYQVTEELESLPMEKLGYKDSQN